MRSRPSRMPKLTPSIVARMRFSGVKLDAEIPRRDPRAAGRSGVRSPLRKGMKVRASAPGLVVARAVSISMTVRPRVSRICVTTLVAFMVQTSGSQPLDEEQKGAILGFGLDAGLLR